MFAHICYLLLWDAQRVCVCVLISIKTKKRNCVCSHLFRQLRAVSCVAALGRNGTKSAPLNALLFMMDTKLHWERHHQLSRTCFSHQLCLFLEATYFAKVLDNQSNPIPMKRKGPANTGSPKAASPHLDSLGCPQRSPQAQTIDDVLHRCCLCCPS